MVESVGGVGLLQEGDGTEEQRAALAHLRERGGEARAARCSSVPLPSWRSPTLPTDSTIPNGYYTR